MQDGHVGSALPSRLLTGEVLVARLLGSIQARVTLATVGYSRSRPREDYSRSSEDVGRHAAKSTALEREGRRALVHCTPRSPPARASPTRCLSGKVARRREARGSTHEVPEVVAPEVDGLLDLSEFDELEAGSLGCQELLVQLLNGEVGELLQYAS